MDAEQFRKAGHAAVDEIIDYFTNLESRHVASKVSPGYLRPLLPAKPPDEGEEWADIQKDIEAKIMPGLTHWQSPDFMAFFPANSTYPSILGEMYSAAFTAPAFNWLCSPACTELETVVLDWLCHLLHLPASYLSTSATGGGGVIQGSASEAIVTVMIAAREQFVRRHCRLAVPQPASEVEAEDGEWRLRTRLVALGSEMSHSSTQKAAMIAGVHYKSIPVDVTDDFALTGRGLTEALQDLTGRGWQPFYLTLTLGTTSTCGVDHFKEIAEVKKQYPNMWVHVDAAYAGAALLLEEYHELTDGFEAFDSFDVNMHKWLLTNFDASCLFLPCREPLISALTITPSYLQNDHSSSGLVTDYRDWQIPLGRRFRALKIWFVLRSYGVNGMKNHVKRHIGLGEIFANWVKNEGSDLFELVAPPRFALTVLRVKLPEEKREKATTPFVMSKAATTETKVDEGLASNDIFPLPNEADGGPQIDTLTRTNALTKEVYERINSTGDILLTSTMIKDCYAIRVVGANEQTNEQHLRKAFEILTRTTEEVLRKLESKAGSE
ncbi:MAG: hypothetical protein L6R36_006535 [Xanthoria steineri]|nr:MAG: hypothetical protein L6R36_006535 [Xanthoria steineri]